MLGGPDTIPAAMRGSEGDRAGWPLLSVGAAFGVILEDAQLGFREMALDSLDGWIVDELLRPGSVLSRGEIGRANAAGDLDMFLLYFKADDEHLSDAGRRYVVQQLMLYAFPHGSPPAVADRARAVPRAGHVRHSGRRAPASTGVRVGRAGGVPAMSCAPARRPGTPSIRQLD
jgi:hypothetical protein